MKALQGIENRKQIFVLDALRYSLLGERRAYARVVRLSRSMEGRPFPARPRESTALAALGSAWQMVDIVYRARGLIRQVKGMSQRSPQVQLFMRETARVEGLRNFFQHLNSSIAGLTAKSYPIMGVLSWVGRDPMMSYSISIGHWTKDTEAHTLAVDTWKNTFVVPLQLDAATTSLNLAAVHEHSIRISAFVERWLNKQGFVSATDIGVSVMRFGIGAVG